jgi:hydroxylamine dehydrogenase
VNRLIVPIAVVLVLGAGLLLGCGPAPSPTQAEQERSPAPPTRVPLQPTPAPPPTAALVTPTAGLSERGKPCVTCHSVITPGIVNDWQDSAHAAARVDCATCHAPAGAGQRPDVFTHNGIEVVTLVTPAQCAQCHPQEASEFLASRHADAARFVGSLDDILGEIVGGGPAANSGCKQCHGSTVQVVAGQPGKLDPATWPNTGIGRINPDGSQGTCTACHSRHGFRIAQARQPEVCGKCHLGPDHPQYEVWWESKHGSRYYEALNEGWYPDLDAPAGQWWPGRQYYIAGPTCASCHISATPSQPVTHDVGTRISWTLRPAVSSKQENWEQKRAAMQDVCANCHSPQFVGNFYSQFDALVALYNDKFAAPAKGVMDKLYADGKLTQTPFDEPIEWVYFELWHHAGRRARTGAAMAGPDYAWWHGMYDVAKSFYTEFVPLARELDPAAVDEILARPEHSWAKGLSPEQIQQMLQFYQEQYGQQP